MLQGQEGICPNLGDAALSNWFREIGHFSFLAYEMTFCIENGEAA